MMSGAVRVVPSYREWPLADRIIDLARRRGADAQDDAKLLLQYLASDWDIDRSTEVEVPDESTWSSWRAARLASPATGVNPGADGGVSATPERVEECRRACSRWRSCMRDYQDSYMCQEDMTRSCRECRDQGLGR